MCRSLDEVQFEEGELDRSRTLTGLHPVSKEDWNDAYDELVRSTMADCGDNSLEDVSLPSNGSDSRTGSATPSH